MSEKNVPFDSDAYISIDENGFGSFKIAVVEAELFYFFQDTLAPTPDEIEEFAKAQDISFNEAEQLLNDAKKQGVIILFRKGQIKLRKTIGPEVGKLLVNLVKKAAKQTVEESEKELGVDLSKGFRTARQKFETFSKSPLGLNTHGGSRNQSYSFKTPEDDKNFALTVNRLRPLWEHILRDFRKGDYEYECLQKVKASDYYKIYSESYGEIPEDLIKMALNQESPKGSKRWPLTYALLHAARKLGQTKKLGIDYSIETLRKHYKAGSKQINQQPKKRQVSKLY